MLEFLAWSLFGGMIIIGYAPLILARERGGWRAHIRDGRWAYVITCVMMGAVWPLAVATAIVDVLFGEDRDARDE